MIECDMCYKGVIRTTSKGKLIYCKYCAGTGKLEAKNKYRVNENYNP